MVPDQGPGMSKIGPHLSTHTQIALIGQHPRFSRNITSSNRSQTAENLHLIALTLSYKNEKKIENRNTVPNRNKLGMPKHQMIPSDEALHSKRQLLNLFAVVCLPYVKLKLCSI